MADRRDGAVHTSTIARLLLLGAAGGALLACGASDNTDANADAGASLDSSAPYDAPREATVDTGADAGADAPPDATAEAEAEAEASAVPDSGAADSAESGLGDFSNCGRVASVSDNIGETTVGLSLTVQGTASGPNPGALTFAWSASPPNAGTFSPATGSGAAPSSQFTCEMPGTVTITLTVSDGTIPDGAPSCQDVDHESLDVVCDPLPDAAAGDSYLDTGEWNG